MALCLRYCKGLEIKERFIGFIDCSYKQDAETLSQTMLDYLKQCNLNPYIALCQGDLMVSKQTLKKSTRTQFTHTAWHTKLI